MKDISFKPLTAFIIALFVIATGDVRALPQQGKIESGSGDLSNPAHITQDSQNLRTSWQSFDIGTSEVVNINQPNAASSIVIGVRNGSATSIDGALNANGHVTLENPAGIQFGESSVVNVGGLVATAAQGEVSSLGQINAANEVHLQSVGRNIYGNYANNGVNVGGAVSAKKIIVESNGDVVIGATAALSASEVSISGRYYTHTTRLEAGVFVRATAEGKNITLTEADFTDAGYTIDNGVLDLGTDGLILWAGDLGRIELPTSVTSIRSSSVTLLGYMNQGAALTFTSAGDLSFTGNAVFNRKVTLEGTDITLSGRLSTHYLTVTARGKLLFGNGNNRLEGRTVSLTSAIAPTAADVAVITGGTTTIAADDGGGSQTVTLNAKINVGTAGKLLISTEGGEKDYSVITRGAIVFGTTAPVELTAKELVFETSSTGGVRGTHPTTLTATGTEGKAFIRVQGSLLFADVNIASSGGFKVTDLLDRSGDVTSYETRLDASGVMRVTLGTPTDAIGGGGVLPRYRMGPGVSSLHELSFFALGGIHWDEGGIDNQRDLVAWFSRSYTSISDEGASVINDNGVIINGVRRPLGYVRVLPQEGKVESGIGDLSNPERIIQNSQNLRTSWHSFDIGTSEVVNIIQPNATSSIVIGVRNGLGTNINGALNANGHVTLENPAGIQFGAISVVNVGGLLATTDQGALSSLGQINAATEVHLQSVGGNIVNVGGAVSAQKIIVESNDDVVIVATADLSAGEVSISSNNYNTHTTGLEAGVFVRAAANDEALVLTATDFTDAGYTIINGVLDLGADGLILLVGAGERSIFLPIGVTSIRSSSVTIIGTIDGGADLTFTSAGDLTFTGEAQTNRNVTLEGTDITFSHGSLRYSRDVTLRYLTVAEDEAGRAGNLKVEIDDGSLSRLSQSADELLKSNCERVKTLDGVAC